MAVIDTMLFNLVYVSAATRLFSKDELAALMKKSAERNATCGLTGLLLYKDGNFMQVIEGSEHEINVAFERIKNDPRHRQIITLLHAPIAARNFPQWNMAFRDLRAGELHERSEYAQFLNTPLTAITSPSQSQKLLHLFKQTM